MLLHVNQIHWSLEVHVHGGRNGRRALDHRSGPSRPFPRSVSQSEIFTPGQARRHVHMQQLVRLSTIDTHGKREQTVDPTAQSFISTAESARRACTEGGQYRTDSWMFEELLFEPDETAWRHMHKNSHMPTAAAALYHRPHRKEEELYPPTSSEALKRSRYTAIRTVPLFLERVQLAAQARPGKASASVAPVISKSNRRARPRA